MIRVLTLFVLLSGAVVPRSAHAQEIWDPIEPVNRAIFTFNDTLDQYILEPVARGYDKVTPDRVKLGVKNFFNNLEYPILLVSDVAQLKFDQAATHTGRFVINSTVGLAGVMDIAKLHGLKPHDEDIGTALGYWGVGPGPYLVLPLLGPSNARDAVGTGVSTFLSPTYYIDDWEITASLKALQVIDARRRLLQVTDTGRESSLDYYSFVQSSYMQHRLNLIYDGNPPPELLEDSSEDDSDTDSGETPEQ